MCLNSNHGCSCRSVENLRPGTFKMSRYLVSFQSFQACSSPGRIFHFGCLPRLPPCLKCKLKCISRKTGVGKRDPKPVLMEQEVTTTFDRVCLAKAIFLSLLRLRYPATIWLGRLCFVVSGGDSLSRDKHMYSAFVLVLPSRSLHSRFQPL